MQWRSLPLGFLSLMLLVAGITACGQPPTPQPPAVTNEQKDKIEQTTDRAKTEVQQSEQRIKEAEKNAESGQAQ